MQSRAGGWKAQVGLFAGASSRTAPPAGSRSGTSRPRASTPTGSSISSGLRLSTMLPPMRRTVSNSEISVPLASSLGSALTSAMRGTWSSVASPRVRRRKFATPSWRRNLSAARGRPAGREPPRRRRRARRFRAGRRRDPVPLGPRAGQERSPPALAQQTGRPRRRSGRHAAAGGGRCSSKRLRARARLPPRSGPAHLPGARIWARARGARRRAARCQLGRGESPLSAGSRRPGRVSSQASTSDWDSTKPSAGRGSRWASAKVRASRVAGRQYITSASIRRAKARSVGAGWPSEGCPSCSWGPANLRMRLPTRYSSGPKTPHRPTNSRSRCRGGSPRFRSHRIAAANAGLDRI
jgi:hypothetical protein